MCLRVLFFVSLLPSSVCTFAARYTFRWHESTHVGDLPPLVIMVLSDESAGVTQEGINTDTCFLLMIFFFAPPYAYE